MNKNQMKPNENLLLWIKTPESAGGGRRKLENIFFLSSLSWEILLLFLREQQKFFLSEKRVKKSQIENFLVVKFAFVVLEGGMKADEKWLNFPPPKAMKNFFDSCGLLEIFCRSSISTWGRPHLLHMQKTHTTWMTYGKSTKVLRLLIHYQSNVKRLLISNVYKFIFSTVSHAKERKWESKTEEFCLEKANTTL